MNFCIKMKRKGVTRLTLLEPHYFLLALMTGLLDMGFVGCAFTWLCKRRNGSVIHERLDRAVCNPNWRNLFPDVTVYRLARTRSDHCPLLLNLLSNSSTPEKRPFKFEKLYFSDPSFPTIVENSWRESGNISQIITNFIDKVKTWSKTYFKNVFKEKRRLLARLLGIQKSLQVRDSSFLSNLEEQLLYEFDQLLKQERE